jgi:hypothetical protein
MSTCVRAQRGEGGLRLAFGQQHRAVGVRRHGLQQRRPERPGHAGELVRGGARGAGVVGGQHDLDARAQVGRAHARVSRFGHHSTDGRRGHVRPPLSQPEQGEPGVRIAARPAGATVQLLGLLILSPQPVQLGQPVPRGTDRLVHRWPGQTVARAFQLAYGAGPLAVEQQHLGAADEARAPVG